METNKVVPDGSYFKTNDSKADVEALVKNHPQPVDDESKFEALKKEISEFIDFGKEEHTKTAKQMLKEERAQYEKRKPCKWMVMIMFMIIGSLFLVIFTKMITYLSNSLYDRSAIEDLMRDMIGRRKISQQISDEIMITAYEFNS